MWPRALNPSISFPLQLPALMVLAGDSRARPLITAARLDMTDAFLVAIIAPSHFTQTLPRLQISREWLFNRRSIAFYYVVTATCMELQGPLCCELGGCIPLLMSIWAV